MQRQHGPVANGAAGPDEIDLRGIGEALWRKRQWVIIPTCAAAVLSLLAVTLMTPRYRSEARILIEGRESVFVRPEAEKSGERDRSNVDPEGVQSQVQVVLSKDLASAVIKQLKLGERPEFDPELHGFSPLRFALTALGLARDDLSMPAEERVLNAYFNRLTAYPVDKSRVIVVEFVSSDPALAARIANTIAETYLLMQQRAKQDQTRAASRWLAGEIDTLRGKVVEAEARAEDYRAKENLFIGTNNTSLSNQQLGELNTQLSAARAQRADTEARARLIRDLLRRGAPIEASDVLNTELLRRLGEQRAVLRSQMAEQSSTLLDQHPRIKELRAQIIEIDRSIKAEAEKIARAFETDARIAGAKMEQISASLDQLKRQSAATSDQDVKLRAFEREARAQRELLETYLARYREASARENLDGIPGDARIISNAVVSNVPSFPKKLPIVFIATLATLFMSSGVILATELMRAGGRNPQDAFAFAELALERDLDRPLAPRVEAPSDSPPAPAQESEELAGAPRTEYTPLDAAGANTRPEIIAVTGVVWQIPSAPVALALAQHLAGQRRVVFVDCTFASPYRGPEPVPPGLADFVRGDCALADILERDPTSSAHLVGAGNAAGDPDDLWASEKLTVALNALARSYDVAIVDAGVPSAKAAPRLARLATRALLVGNGVGPERVLIARERLLAAGFADIVDVGGGSSDSASGSARVGAPQAA